MRYCFLQVSTNLINKNIPADIASEYYRKIWTARKDSGYKKPEPFWEIPVWIAELSYVLPDTGKQLFIIEKPNMVLPDADVYFMSVLDVNKHVLRYIIRTNPDKTFHIGGYVDESYFDGLKNCRWSISIESYCNYANIDYKYGTDYSLFAGLSCIPRLTLSTGCKHHCRFCTIPNEIEKTRSQDILQQVESFKDLDFQLVYINDKTFGQCDNYDLLTNCYNIIKEYNPAFKGFIVQTTCQQVLSFDHIHPDIYEDLHIEVVELGIETYNNGILKKYCKPQNCKTIDRAINILEKQQVKIIPNIMIGLIGENKRTYENTLYWLLWNRNRFLLLNVYNFVVYADADIADAVSTSDADKNELSKSRSYHSTADTAIIDVYSQSVYETGIEILKLEKK
jgi:radical SAM superfamily enzyme YgiQ (UPF0313 family)